MRRVGFQYLMISGDFDYFINNLKPSKIENDITNIAQYPKING